MQTPWGDLPVVDSHVHFLSRRFFQALQAQLPEPAPDLEALAARLGWNLPPEDPAGFAGDWFAELERHGLSRSAVIASIPADEASVLAAAAAYPDRFIPFAMVNPLAGNATIAEGLKAICLFPAMHRYSLHDERVTHLLDQAVERRCAVFVHCGMLTVGVRRKLGLPSPFDMRFSNPLDLHGIALRYPSLSFIVPHFGAGLFREALMLADLCPNVYLDTSSSNSWMRYEGLDLKTVFRRALDIVGPRRLLFGTDSSFFPRGWNYDVFDLQCRTLLDIGVSSADMRAILGENLAGIVGKSTTFPPNIVESISRPI